MIEGDKIARATRNETFYLVARICSIVSTIVLLPVVIWSINRVIAQADAATENIQRQNIKLEILQTTIHDALDRDAAQLKDHETRIRVLERINYK